MNLTEFLELIKMANVNWRIVEGRITPSPISWLAKNLGKGKGKDEIDKALAIGLDIKTAWVLLNAIEYPNTNHILVRMELERLCK